MSRRWRVYFDAETDDYRVEQSGFGDALLVLVRPQLEDDAAAKEAAAIAAVIAEALNAREAES